MTKIIHKFSSIEKTVNDAMLTQCCQTHTYTWMYIDVKVETHLFRTKIIKKERREM